MSHAGQVPPSVVLTKRVAWYGAATGYYGMLPPALAERGCPVETVMPRAGLGVRLAGKLWSQWHGMPPRHQSLAFAEWEFLRRFDRTRGPGLLLALEDNLPLLRLRRFVQRAAPRRLVGVVHYPPALWNNEMLASLRRLRSALVLYRRDIAFFEQHVGVGRVLYVPHGVDTAHFSPAGERAVDPIRLLVTGQFGRDFQLLAEIFPLLRRRFATCQLDIIGAHHARAEAPVRALAAMEGVTVHGPCSDAELLEHYRRATLLLLPLRVSGANNALVEALSCGLPIVATDTGGVRDYGGGEVFPLTPQGDAAAFVEAVTALLHDAPRRREISAAARRLAETTLAWRDVAVRHQEAIARLCPECFGEEPAPTLKAKARHAVRSLRRGTAAALGRLPGSSAQFGPPRRERLVPTDGGATVHALSAARNTQRPPARYADPTMAKRFASMGEGTVKPRFVAELEGGRYWGRGYGYVIDRDDALQRALSPAFSDYTAEEARHDGLEVPMLPRVRRIAGTCVALGTPFCENFHHWLLDAVPKFELLRATGWGPERIDTWFMPDRVRHSWHWQTLERLGISRERIVFMDARVHLQAERLIVPSYSEPGREPERYDYTPEGLAFVRQLFGIEQKRREGGPKKILLSRARAATRRWLGDEAAHARLAREGFVTVYAEEHTVAEQAALFAGAESVIMPTGGGLANLAFCAPGTRVVELFSPTYLPTFSLVLAGELGLEYCALVGEGEARHGDAGTAQDIAVPVERILEALR